MLPRKGKAFLSLNSVEAHKLPVCVACLIRELSCLVGKTEFEDKQLSIGLSYLSVHFLISSGGLVVASSLSSTMISSSCPESGLALWWLNYRAAMEIICTTPIASLEQDWLPVLPVSGAVIPLRISYHAVRNSSYVEKPHIGVPSNTPRWAPSKPWFRVWAILDASTPFYL